MKVDQLRQALIDLGVEEAEVAKMTKPQLITSYEKLSVVSTDDEFDFNTESSGASEPVSSLQEAIGVRYGSPEWTQYVLGQLNQDEHVDGYPKCSGLRRVAPMILGPIISSKASFVHVSHSEPRSVTVNYEVVFDWALDTIVGFGNLEQRGDLRTFGGLADCVESNNTYGVHPAATAETKAESRALRKALAINVITAEEITSGQRDDPPKKTDDRINNPLKQVIQAKAKQLGLDLGELCKKAGIDKIIDEITMGEGRKLIALINSAQQVPSSQ